MRQRILSAALSAGVLFGAAAPGFVQIITGRIATARMVSTPDIGAAGEAGIGALPAAAKRAGIGAIAGAGGGALYDARQKHHGHN
jgi:hypothetical protein